MATLLDRVTNIFKAKKDDTNNNKLETNNYVLSLSDYLESQVAMGIKYISFPRVTSDTNVRDFYKSEEKQHIVDSLSFKNDISSKKGERSTFNIESFLELYSDKKNFPLQKFTDIKNIDQFSNILLDKLMELPPMKAYHVNERSKDTRAYRIDVDVDGAFSPLLVHLTKNDERTIERIIGQLDKLEKSGLTHISLDNISGKYNTYTDAEYYHYQNENKKFIVSDDPHKIRELDKELIVGNSETNSLDNIKTYLAHNVFSINGLKDRFADKTIFHELKGFNILVERLKDFESKLQESNLINLGKQFDHGVSMQANKNVFNYSKSDAHFYKAHDQAAKELNITVKRDKDGKLEYFENGKLADKSNSIKSISERMLRNREIHLSKPIPDKTSEFAKVVNKVNSIEKLNIPKINQKNKLSRGKGYKNGL